MESTHKEFGDYFLQELKCLRTRAADFGEEYPGIARELQLGRGRSADPHIELLLQSFAFMAARLNCRIDNDGNAIPDAMLNTLVPSCAAPVPAMSVAQIKVKPTGANYVNGFRLDRGRTLYAHASTGSGKSVKCLFTTCYAADLLPFSVESAGWVSVNQVDFLRDRTDVQSALRLVVRNDGTLPFHNYKRRTLRFFIGRELPFALTVYDLLFGHCREAVVRGDHPGGTFSSIRKTADFLGFDDSHSVLPTNAASHRAYRLIQEYFFFPEKFLFFELPDVPLDNCESRLEIYFLMDVTPENRMPVHDGMFLLNCTPVINCFEATTDPIVLDHRHYEYRVIADQRNHRYQEIYSILSMEAVTPKGSPRRIASYFTLDRYGQDAAHDYFWTSRRENSLTKEVQGTETYVSFHDAKFDVCAPAEELIYAKALCTNRRLAENMQAGCAMTLEGPGPVESCELVIKPSRYHPPQSSGFKSWRLVSNLTVNHLAFSASASGTAALKSALSLYADENSTGHNKQVESITDVCCRRIQKRIGGDAWRGFCNGFEIAVTVDETVFEGGSLLLFGSTVAGFLALYAHVNSFTQLLLKSKQRGLIRIWPPMAGEQELV